MAEPLITQFAKIGACGGIELIALQRGRSPLLHYAIVVGADDQSMVRVRVISKVLAEEVQVRRLAIRVVAGRRQDRNIELRELLAIRHQLLPVPIVARMIEPADENRIGPAEYAAQIPIPTPAPVPSLIERGPLRLIVIAVAVR